MNDKKLIIPAIVAITAAVGFGAGALTNGATANAESASSTTSTSSTMSVRDESKGGHQANGKTETLLTGDNLSKASAAAQAAVSGGTVLRAETEVDGNGTYEVHMTKSDGSRVTVYLDDNFKVTSTEAGPNGGPNHDSDTSSSSTTSSN